MKNHKPFLVPVTCIAAALVAAVPLTLVSAATELDKSKLSNELTAEKITVAFPEGYQAPAKASTPTKSSQSAKKSVKTIYYHTKVWGSVKADFSDFRTKVAETLSDSRGWVRAGLKFQEVSAKSKADVDVILSSPARLGKLSGCSSELSCTTWNNQVIINDVRWRTGTTASNKAGMSQRDYQHMVVNHEMGHWLGHYQHEPSCPNGGPAPVMLQQSTGLRGCDSFNAWPLDSELWTNKK